MAEQDVSSCGLRASRRAASHSGQEALILPAGHPEAPLQNAPTVFKEKANLRVRSS